MQTFIPFFLITKNRDGSTEIIRKLLFQNRNERLNGFTLQFKRSVAQWNCSDKLPERSWNS